MEIVRFVYPWVFWLLLLLPGLVAYYIFRQRQGGATLRISTVDGARSALRSVKYRLRHLPFVLRCLAVALLIFAMARPQNSQTTSSAQTEGIDIVISLDISGSMLARDFKPDRIGAAKEVAAEFINSRPSDRIGLVVFAGESFTQSPLTTDKKALLGLLNRVNAGMIEDGTAIGNGLATAVNRLRDSDAESKVVILLTDGVNNRGQIAPLTAAEIAQTFGVRVYTVGVGTTGKAPYPMMDRFGRIGFQMADVEIDEDILREIAAKTGGRYFRATDKDKLREVYNEINALEKTRVEVEDYTRYGELFSLFALLALGLLFVEFALNYLWLRRLP